MQNNFEMYNSILSDLSNFSLVFFGFSISLFTLLYSFIATRRDALKEYNDRVKQGMNDPVLHQRISNAVIFIKKMRTVSLNFIVTIVLEISSYLICIISKYVIYDINIKKIIVYIAGSLAAIIFIYLGILLSCVIKDFTKNTKI